MIGRLLFDGEFEDTVCQLAGLTWEKKDGRVVLRGMTVLTPFGASPPESTVARRGGGWKIIHVDGP